MEKLEHPLWIVDFVNAILGPPVRAIGEALGYHFTGHHVIPNYVVMVLLIVARADRAVPDRALTAERREPRQAADRARGRRRARWSGCSTNGSARRAPQFLPLVATLGVFILVGNYMGLVPGLMAPTSNINVTLGCALTTGCTTTTRAFARRASAPYLMHFAAPPGTPLALAPIMLPIELISHLSRVMSLSLRLFGNIFGEELVILILFSSSRGWCRCR